MPTGNPMWKTPTGKTSQWAQKPHRDETDAQRKYDEAELRGAVETRKSFWGKERKYDSRGREIKDPSRQRGLFSDGWF